MWLPVQPALLSLPAGPPPSPSPLQRPSACFSPGPCWLFFLSEPPNAEQKSASWSSHPLQAAAHPFASPAHLPPEMCVYLKQRRLPAESEKGGRSTEEAAGMKGGLESQASFGGGCRALLATGGRVASDTHWPHVRTPDLLGSERTLCPLLRLSVFPHLLFLGTEPGALCVCVRVRE